jgi:lipoprotein NlpI
VYVSRGILYGQGFKDLKKAHEDLNKAISMNSKNFAAYYYNGIFYQDEKDYGKSKDMFDKVIELSPEYGEGYFRRAMASYGIGILNMTCKDFDKAIQLGFR